MSLEVVMPQMGESITEGTVSKWLKQVGEKVEKDESLLEISTDKVDAEIPDEAEGYPLQKLWHEKSAQLQSVTEEFNRRKRSGR